MQWKNYFNHKVTKKKGKKTALWFLR